MMSECLILVDNSNVFIEGRKFSARRKGVHRRPGDTRDPQDFSWRLDFGQLLSFLANGRGIIDAILVGSTPPKNDSVWTSAERQGFRVLTYERDAFSGAEKEVDTEIATQAAEIIVGHGQPGILVLGSGDRDFLPTVRCAHRRHWTVEMCAFSNAFNPTGQMAISVDTIRQLDGAIDQIGRHDF